MPCPRYRAGPSSSRKPAAPCRRSRTSCGGPAGPQEAALALVAIEGVAWELVGEDGEALADPAIVARLAGILLAALGALRP